MFQLLYYFLVPSPVSHTALTLPQSGMLGGYLRVVTVGLLDMKSGCSAEIVALSPPAARVQPQPVSVAMVRILTTGYNGTNRTMRYLRLI